MTAQQNRDALARLLSGRAAALGFAPANGGQALVLRVRRGWCLACAVTRRLWSPPRVGCSCADDVARRDALAKGLPKGRADRVRLGWCASHAGAPLLRGRRAARPPDCLECMAGLPDFGRLLAEAQAVGFLERHAVEPIFWADVPSRLRPSVLARVGADLAAGCEPRGLAVLDGLAVTLPDLLALPLGALADGRAWAVLSDALQGSIDQRRARARKAADRRADFAPLVAREFAPLVEGRLQSVLAAQAVEGCADRRARLKAEAQALRLFRDLRLGRILGDGPEARASAARAEADRVRLAASMLQTGAAPALPRSRRRW